MSTEAANPRAGDSQDDPAEAEETVSVEPQDEGRDLVANPRRHVPFDEAAFAREPGQPLWVFGYGSLMWNPGFAHLETRKALLFGYHRAFCIKSEHYRGTPEFPGLVLGLDEGGTCRGLAFRIAEEDAGVALPYLWDREMVTMVYRPARAKIRFLDAPTDVPGSPPAESTETAFTFVARPDHRQYCCRTSPEEVGRIVARAVGKAGPNRDYLANTAAHLRALDLEDPEMEDLLRHVEADA